MSVLEALFQRQESRQETAEQEILKLVTELASDPDAGNPESIEQLLSDAGWTPEKLRRAVGRQKHINTAMALHDAHDRLSAEKPNILAGIQAADDKLAAARAERDAAVRPLNLKLTAINDAKQAAFHADLALRDLISDDDRKRINAARWQMELQRRAVDDANKQVVAAKARVDAAVKTPGGWVKDGETVVDEPARASALAAVKRAEERAKEAGEALSAASERLNATIAKAMSATA